MSDDNCCSFTWHTGGFSGLTDEGVARCRYAAVTKGLCADHGGARDAIHLNYIGAVDQGDVGKKTFRLSELFSTADLADGEDHEMEVSVELVTDNTSGALAARA